MPGLTLLNALPEQDLVEVLLGCCNAPGWVPGSPTGARTGAWRTCWLPRMRPGLTAGRMSWMRPSPAIPGSVSGP